MKPDRSLRRLRFCHPQRLLPSLATPEHAFHVPLDEIRKAWYNKVLCCIIVSPAMRSGIP